MTLFFFLLSLDVQQGKVDILHPSFFINSGAPRALPSPTPLDDEKPGESRLTSRAHCPTNLGAALLPTRNSSLLPSSL